MAANGAENAGNVPEPEKEKSYTDPDAAADFVNRTHVDALAVTFGTMHGFYEKPPKLDIERLRAIRAKVDKRCSLVMHGSSGVEPGEIKKAIDGGIRKINYYTYLSIQVAPMLVKTVEKSPERTYYHDLTNRAYEFLKDRVKEIILGSRNQ
jgi:fructose-bisphosphate aldolase class II